MQYIKVEQEVLQKLLLRFIIQSYTFLNKISI